MSVFKLNNLRLRSKILFLPVGIVLITFFIMAALITKEIINRGHHEYIKGQEKLIHSSLSLMTSTQSPADAFFGIDAEDYVIADEVINKLKNIGLNSTYFITKDMTQIYPEDRAVLKRMKAISDSESLERGDTHIFYEQPNLTGVAPVFDVETQTGFLLVMNEFPEELNKYIVSVLHETDSKDSSIKEQNSVKAIQANSTEFLKKILITLALIILPCLGVIFFILRQASKHIIIRINELFQSFKKFSEGKLNTQIQDDSGDELGELSAAFNKMSSKLSKTINNTINSMDELTSSFHNVAASSSQAASSAQNASELAFGGGELVSKTAEGMLKISLLVNDSTISIKTLGDSSEKIGEIIQVINEIADQTNLLALNAAIEAARAGEQGRGFAVVADEVRKLAERTTSATKEIKEKINAIQHDTDNAVVSMQSGKEQVDTELQLASDAGKALQQIVDSVKNVTDAVTQIASAAEEQSLTAEMLRSDIESTFHVKDNQQYSDHQHSEGIETQEKQPGSHT